MGVHVADGDSQCISGIGIQRFSDDEEIPYHVLHLILIRFSIADDRLLDLEGAVLENGKPRVDSCEDCSTPCLSEEKGASRILGYENVFDCHGCGLATPDDFHQLLINHPEAFWKRQLAAKAYGPVGQVAQSRSIAFHDSVACKLRTGVDSNDAVEWHCCGSRYC